MTKTIRFETTFPHSVSSKLDRLVPNRSEEIDIFASAAYVSLVEGFKWSAGNYEVDEMTAQDLEHSENNQAPGEPTLFDLLSDKEEIKTAQAYEICFLSGLFEEAGISNRERMPLINQIVATARCEAQMG